MTPQLDQLVRDVAELTGSARPAWLEDDAPLLDEQALSASADVGGDGNADGFYLVGIIGGKDVGKSALVNALVGDAITAQTSHGPGTEAAIAYAHESQAAALTQLLQREVPGKFRIVTHGLAHLRRQVLVDLPDIDSHFAEHLDVTRRMLRHMLFPVWVQSVEKYADRQPQELLCKVAAGNAPGNFVFCLNKVDQVEGSQEGSWLRVQGSGEEAKGAGSCLNPEPRTLNPSLNPVVQELRDDYAQRLARILQLSSPPRVWAICAVRPQRYDLPALRAVLAQQKSDEDVRQSKQRAALRQRTSVLAWLNEQDLPARAARLARLQEDAEDFVAERLGTPLLGQIIPSLVDDPIYRRMVVDDCLHKRVARWPIVNLLHGLFATLGGLVRRNTEPRPRLAGNASGTALVDQCLATLGGGTSEHGAGDGSTFLAGAIQTTFALLQQMCPALGPLYRDRKLWEAMPASLAAADLRDRLAATVNRQRDVIASAAAGRDSSSAAFVRGLLTVAALIWFPLVQPVLQQLLDPIPAAGTRGLLFTLVSLLSLQNLLATLLGLAIYYTLIWAILRWDTHRRVARHLARYRAADNDGADSKLSLPAQVLVWLNGLTDPIRAERERYEALAERIKVLSAEC